MISRQPPQASQRQESFEISQASASAGPRDVMLVVPRELLAVNRAFFEGVDRLEHLGQGVGVGGGKRAPAGEPGEPLEQLEVRPGDVGQ